jgi:hypothetical protein
MSGEITITVKCSNTDKDTFVVDVGLTIGEFKDAIAEKMGVPVSAQRLIFKGRVLKDELTLEHYGMNLPFDVLYCLIYIRVSVLRLMIPLYHMSLQRFAKDRPFI